MGALQEITDEVHSLLTGFGLTSARSAWLKTDVDEGATQLALDGDTTSMGEGVAEIDDELVYVRRYATDTNSLLVAPDGRGYDGTVAAAHTEGARIRLEPPYPKVSIKRAVNRAITRSFPIIWGTGVTEFTYQPSKTTYALPAGTTQVLGVSFDTWGSTGAWLDINSYSFDGAADPETYPTGKTITLGSPAIPGREVRVLYASSPKELVEADASFAATGLASSARYAIILGSVAELLRFADPVRLSTSAAESDELDTKKQIGSALRIANDFEAQFQNELKNEAQRLRQTYPARIVRKKF